MKQNYYFNKRPNNLDFFESNDDIKNSNIKISQTGRNNFNFSIEKLKNEIKDISEKVSKLNKQTDKYIKNNNYNLKNYKNPKILNYKNATADIPINYNINNNIEKKMKPKIEAILNNNNINYRNNSLDEKLNSSYSKIRSIRDNSEKSENSSINSDYNNNNENKIMNLLLKQNNEYKNKINYYFYQIKQKDNYIRKLEEELK